MRALILGVGDAFTKRSFGSSALIDAPEGFVLIDCPDPIHRVLDEATTKARWPVDADNVTDLVLTHLHGDHCNGVESFGFHHRIRRNEDATRPVPRLHASRPVLDRLWERLAPAMDGPFGGDRSSCLSDYFQTHELDPDVPATVAGLRVECRFTGHPVPTVGLRIGDDSGTLGWSSDTPYEAAHLAWLESADVIVHESNHGPAHTPIGDLNALPAAVRRRMRLIHLPDDFDRACTELVPLQEGEVLVVEST